MTASFAAAPADTPTPAPRARVLYLTKVVPYPPANAGDAVYSRGIIEAIAVTTDLTVLCADSGGTIPEDQARALSWNVAGPQRGGRAGSVLSRWPLIAWKSATPEYLARLDQLLTEDWDAIVLDNLGLAHALPRAERYRAAHPGTRLVYISHEYEYPTRAGKYDSYHMSLPKRLVANRDLAKVKASEEAMLRAADIVTVINTNDLVPFRKIDPDVKYLPLTPGYNGPVSAARVIGPDTPRRILLLGGRRSEQKQQILLDWMEFAYDRINAAGIEMIIAGDMHESLHDTLTRRYPQTQVLGFVANLEALIASARMGVIADTIGGGFKLRLLSHVFERLPMVGLSGAISGLPTPEGAGYLGAADLQELITLVCAVCDDTDRLNALQERAFNDCAEAYAWSARAEAFTAAVTGQTDGHLV
ncbi:hypothetical protein CEW88_23425 (plasmid) [Alloyangia pacifica]|uniref:Glycosyltransferase subfamily 4-like N-terminal domain-containing protein n=1 Tax=Alloyangia pacifica TaxID=311180 RepID=A0A2U8HL89_9RHOB|nr:hypothetical protein [Alloyangia pacifica]AWI86719.1 hypothetical protein CEW88_23425 [Alloyangia pacifica]